MISYPEFWSKGKFVYEAIRRLDVHKISTKILYLKRELGITIKVGDK